jgi:hypothetical protein
VLSIDPQSLSLINPGNSSTEIQIDQHESSIVFQLQPDGWVSSRSDLNISWRRMCWLPYKRRNGGRILTCYGQRVVIVAAGGVMTILDFSDI